MDYLIKRYHDLKRWECDKKGEKMNYALIHVAYQREIKYKVKDSPLELFERGVQYLQKRIQNTKLGRIKRKEGHELFSSFDNFDKQDNANIKRTDKLSLLQLHVEIHKNAPYYEEPKAVVVEIMIENHGKDFNSVRNIFLQIENRGTLEVFEPNLNLLQKPLKIVGMGIKPGALKKGSVWFSVPDEMTPLVTGSDMICGKISIEFIRGKSINKPIEIQMATYLRNQDLLD